MGLYGSWVRALDDLKLGEKLILVAEVMRSQEQRSWKRTDEQEKKEITSPSRFM